MKKKYAFTLAETLIAMIIGGVLSMLLIKAISSAMPDKEQIQFLKAFHTLEAATANITNDGTRYDQNHGATANTTLDQKPLDTAEATVNGTKYDKNSLTAKNAYCIFLAEQMNTIDSVNCESGNNSTNFTTTNSFTFQGLSGDFNGDYKDVVVYIRTKKNNNAYVIRIMKDGRLTIPDSTTAANISTKNLCKEKYWYENQSATKKATKKQCDNK